LLERNWKALELIRSCPEDRPLAVQLYGSKPEEMRDAALFLESQGADVVDVNMGCPMRKVFRHGSGSALLGDLEKAQRLAKMMIEAVRVPVTCKMRLGLDEENITAPELARALEDVGVAAITVHGRTREQGFAGKVNLTGIRAVVQALRHTPVIGNGDVTAPVEAEAMLDETGCSGIGIGRGAFYNPWIFRQTESYLATGKLPAEPTFDERVEFMTRHLDRMIEFYGEESGCRQFRKVALAYLKPFGPVTEFRRRVVTLRTRAEFDEMLATYRVWRQSLLAGAR
jgi:nifR3 family TIM-barrel protein